MKRSWLILLLMVSLGFSGCSSFNPLSILQPNKPAVEVNAQVGKTNEQEQNNIKLEQGKTEQTADTISNDTSYKADVVNQIVNGLTWWQLVAIIVLAGVALPSWKELGYGVKLTLVEGYKGVRFVLADILQLLVVPVKGVRDFLLSLFGKSSTIK
jgi:hypothetical protein